MPNFPPVILAALTLIHGLVFSDRFRHGRTKGVKKMRIERVKGLETVLSCLVRATCLLFAGKCCRVENGGTLARGITVEEIAMLAHMNPRTVERCLHDLVDMGLLKAEKQRREWGRNGLTVFAVARTLTSDFWEAIGLGEAFKKGVAYAQEHSRLLLKPVFKFIPKTQSESWKAAFSRAFSTVHEKKGRRRAKGEPQAAGDLLKQLGLA